MIIIQFYLSELIDTPVIKHFTLYFKAYIVLFVSAMRARFRKNSESMEMRTRRHLPASVQSKRYLSCIRVIVECLAVACTELKPHRLLNVDLIAR